jgi:hypothetical protein
VAPLFVKKRTGLGTGSWVPLMCRTGMGIRTWLTVNPVFHKLELEQVLHKVRNWPALFVVLSCPTFPPPPHIKGAPNKRFPKRPPKLKKNVSFIKFFKILKI